MNNFMNRGRSNSRQLEDDGSAAPAKLGNVDTSDSRNMQETIAKLKGIVGLPGGEQYGNITMPEIVKSMYQKSQSPTTPTPADHFTNLPSGSPEQIAAMQNAVGMSSSVTPADHFTKLPSGSNQQFNAMRSAIGLPSMEDSGSDDNDVNVQKAKNMMGSIVGLTPNTNNYSMQDVQSQLRGQYTAPGGMQGMGAPAPAISGGQGMGLAGMQAPTAPQVPDQPMDYGNSGFDGGGGGGMKHGGKIKAFSKGGFTGRDGIAQRGKTKAFAKGGSVSASSRGDGCAQRGKTRGMMR